MDDAWFVRAATWYTAGSNQVIFSDPLGELDAAQVKVEDSPRRWRDDELLLPRALTTGRSSLKLRIEFVSSAHPLYTGGPTPPSAWSEYRYTVYSFVKPH